MNARYIARHPAGPSIIRERIIRENIISESFIDESILNESIIMHRGQQNS